ncbi:glucosamine-6-phosphate isomerase [Glaciibacter superstes]|uniref:glucosamine-6-phosphate isomerase n=1 Tax=Glaciibacter superstes TaxID=501023 RepID=UPI0003B5808E|nr:glucosamine-6-phosphate isomerase [Glaciibacter superstes]
MAESLNSSSDDGFTYNLAKFIEFRDVDECARVRAITREELSSHSNPDFAIRVIDDAPTFYSAFATDLVDRIVEARDEGRELTAILPCGPVPQYEIATERINRERISLKHVRTFNMDEYANEDGQTAPYSWVGSFQRAMYENFFLKIDEELRPDESNIHFPTTETLPGYSDSIAQLGGADVCFGGIGWGGHIAFWEPQLGHEFGGDLETYKTQGARMVELHPMTIMQNALHSFGSDWSWVPPRAATIGPAEILGAKHRSFWLDGDLGGGHSWQRFIARLVAYGPVSEFVPGSLLQLAPTSYTLRGNVADNVEVSMA